MIVPRGGSRLRRSMAANTPSSEAGEQRHAEAAPTHCGVLARTLPAAMLTSADNANKG